MNSNSNFKHLKRFVKNKFFLQAASLIYLSQFFGSALAGDLTVNINSSSGGSLPNAATFKVQKGPNFVGTYTSGTTISLQDGATYTVWAIYDNTSTKRETFVSDPGGNTFNFKTTSVTFHFSGGYLDYRGAGSWSSFGKTSGQWNTRELFPKDFYGNTMEIHTGYAWNDTRSYNFTIDYEGKSSIVKTIAILRVLDHNGDPIQGITFRGGYSNPTSWFVPGSTNASGYLAELRDGNQTSLSYEAKVNNTVSWIGPQNPNNNAYYLFQTIELTLKLQTCAAAPLSGGNARYGNGATHSTWFFPSPNSTDANGETKAEFFPGTYSFEMNYQSTANAKTSVSIPNANTTLTWSTTLVTLSWPYDISYGGNGNSRYFNKPSMELLPGTVNFNFRGQGNNYVALEISGCSLSHKGVAIKLINSGGSPLAGGIAGVYTGSWSTVGTTPSSGIVFTLFNSNVNTAYFRMTYANGTQQIGSLNINSNPLVTFQTKNVTVEFKKSNGDYYDTEGSNVQYYSGSWATFGSGTTSNGKCNMELLPVSYYFRLSAFNQTQQKGSINIASLGATPTITFQTVVVTLKLNNADGSGTHEGDNLAYYAGGTWDTFESGSTQGSGTESMELLPGSYYFRMSYAGKSQQIGSVSISGDQTIHFQTVLLTLRLLNSAGNGTLEASNLEYYTGSWNTFGSGSTTGSGTESMELIPGSYYFRMSYAGKSQQKGSLNINSSQTVDFQTVDVTLRLLDAAGTSTHEAEDLEYYTGTWNTFGSGSTTGTGTETMQLLPGSYYFRLSYENKSQQKGSFNINASQTIDFQTVLVTQYLSDGSNPIEGGIAQYYSGTWYAFGTTDYTGNTEKELLPGSYYFKMTYDGKTKQKGSYTINAATTIEYTYSSGVMSRTVQAEPVLESEKISPNGHSNHNTGLKERAGIQNTPVQTPLLLQSSLAKVKYQVYPNPVTSIGNIAYEIGNTEYVEILIYNSTGELVETLTQETQEAGLYTLSFDMTLFAEGIYYIRIQNGSQVQQVPIIVTH